MNIGVAIGIPFMSKVKKILMKDSFTDVDGISLPLHVPEKGGNWQSLSGTWIINSGKATRSVAVAASDMVCIDVNNPNVSVNVLTEAVVLPVGFVALRVKDINNYLMCFVTSTDIKLYKSESNVFTVLSTHTITFNPLLQQNYTFICNGNVLVFLVNGVEHIRYTTTLFMNETKFGIVCGSTTNNNKTDKIEVSGL
jgi:hypothetical protein